MLTVPSQHVDLLFPWGELSGASRVPRAESLRPEDLPEPYGKLLAHRRDMTSTLEHFHRQRVRLKVLERSGPGRFCSRRVLLVGEDDGRPVELGAIRIDLEAFPRRAAEAITRGRRPLGRILADFSLPYRSRPRAFFRLWPDAMISHALDLEPDHPEPLYGRRNQLSEPQGRVLADVVEILPPVPAAEAAPPA